MDYMVDLETMGTKATAPIIAIGAVAFNSEEIIDRFYMVVDLQSSVDSGAVMDTSTVLWWLQQSDEARAAFARKGEQLGTALRAFSTFVTTLGNRKTAKIWGNGASFDNVILGESYDRLKLERPWEFWNDRCYRTVKNMYPNIQLDRKGTAHNALDDAETQALHLMKMWKS